ncbi:MAG: GAF domain-containing protein [Deltaproteobacteria bacterium]|nr:GAF domain-containing protein [Deltaproteobacteria bacterium]
MESCRESYRFDESMVKSEFSCRALNSILVYMDGVYGRKALEELIRKTGLSLDYLQDHHNWVSWSYYCNLLKNLVEVTGDPRSPYIAGTRSWDKKSWGFFYYITYALGNVRMVLRKVAELVPHFNKGAEWEILELQKNRATIRIRMREGYPIDRVCCESRMGQLAGIPRAFGMPLGKVRESRCQARGDEACRVELSWLNRPRRFYGFLGLMAAIGILFVNDRMNIIRPGLPGPFLLLFSSYLVGRVFDFRGVLHHYKEQTEALEESVKVIEAKYLNLQKANDGVRTLHEISQAVTGTLHMEDLLDILLKMVVERLGFDRSVVFLTDSAGAFLQKGRSYGDAALTEAVRNLSVPVHFNSSLAEEVLRRQQATIVTAEFLAGEQASDLGRKISELTGTREYVVAPLVSKGSLLGVIAADKVRSGSLITQHDLSLMESLANTVAVAIENARTLATIEEMNLDLEKKVEERTQKLKESLRELREAQAQLIHTEKMSSLGVLFTGLAHEINNPVNFAYNGTAALEKKLRKIHALSRGCASAEGSPGEKEERAARLLEAIVDSERIMKIISRGLQRTHRLISHLKQFACRRPEELEPILPESPLRSALTILHHEMAGRIAVRTENRFRNRIMGHPDQLNQLFLNLLHNAVQAIRGSGNIRITIEKAPKGEDAVSVCIRDDGAGIRPEDLPRVFEPFYTTKKSGEGTGLGLGICRRIVENHGGRIALASEVGNGTEVTVILPVGGCPAKAEGASEGGVLGTD